jgi:hypothetical protein
MITTEQQTVKPIQYKVQIHNNSVFTQKSCSLLYEKVKCTGSISERHFFVC